MPDPGSAIPPSETAPVRRPRLLVPLALLSFFYATLSMVSAWMLIAALTGSNDGFESTMRDSASSMIGVGGLLGTPDDMQRVASRKARALWSRRGVLIPVSCASAVAALLLLAGATRATRRGPRAAWGRSAWQLGAVLAVPCTVLDSVVGYLHARDWMAAIADLHDPLANQLRALMPLQGQMSWVRTVLEGLFLLGVARYLASDAVVRYCAEEPRR